MHENYLEYTSDRLALNLNNSNTTEIPLEVVHELSAFRNAGIIPKPPIITIVNTHSEAAIDLKTDIKMESIVKSAGNMLTSDKHPIQIEPILETLDLYALDDTTQTSQRLRFYIQGGKRVSTRIITTSIDTSLTNEWKFEGYAIKARSECVFVQRDDMLDEDIVNQWIGWKKDLFIAVNKRVWRANFGIDRMWDHRGVVSRDFQGNLVDITQRDSIRGMGPYISLSFQEIALGKPQTMNLSAIAEIIAKAQNGELNFDPTHINSRRIEVECKGREYESEGANLVKQVAHLVGKKGINYQFAKSRKISSQANI